MYSFIKADKNATTYHTTTPQPFYGPFKMKLVT